MQIECMGLPKKKKEGKAKTKLGDQKKKTVGTTKDYTIDAMEIHNMTLPIHNITVFTTHTVTKAYSVNMFYDVYYNVYVFIIICSVIRNVSHSNNVSNHIFLVTFVINIPVLLYACRWE